jgi:hypothetical protein
MKLNQSPTLKISFKSLSMTLGIVTAMGAFNSSAFADAHLKPMMKNPGSISEIYSGKSSGVKHPKPAPTPSRQSGQLSYYGGSVLANVKVISVMWGGSVDAKTVAQVGSFYAAVTHSNYMDWLTEYNTNLHAVDGRQGTGQTIGRGSFLKQVQIAPSRASGKVSDSEVQAEITKQINAGLLPAPDANTLYMIHFPSSVTITQGGGGGQKVAVSCQDFCAYHSAYQKNSAQVNYGVIPDLGSNGCETGCGHFDTFSNLTITASHEMIEAITDSGVGLATGNGPNFPMGWYDSRQGEIGDLCARTSGSIPGSAGTTFKVQGEWSNSKNACVTH